MDTQDGLSHGLGLLVSSGPIGVAEALTLRSSLHLRPSSAHGGLLCSQCAYRGLHIFWMQPSNTRGWMSEGRCPSCPALRLGNSMVYSILSEDLSGTESQFPTEVMHLSVWTIGFLPSLYHTSQWLLVTSGISFKRTSWCPHLCLKVGVEKPKFWQLPAVPIVNFLGYLHIHLFFSYLLLYGLTQWLLSK